MYPFFFKLALSSTDQHGNSFNHAPPLPSSSTLLLLFIIVTCFCYSPFVIIIVIVTVNQINASSRLILSGLTKYSTIGDRDDPEDHEATTSDLRRSETAKTPGNLVSATSSSPWHQSAKCKQKA
jgi:hypothetical protein